MYKSILVPYDNSDHAKEAVKAAIDLAKPVDGTVTLLSVSDLPSFDDLTFVSAARMAGVQAIGEDQVQEIQREFYASLKANLIEEAAEVVGDFQNVQDRATAGKATTAIVEFAESGNYDLIVMGCRGLSAIRGAMGSVSYAVARSVKLPVLIVK